jgi:hypothetical protein
MLSFGMRALAAALSTRPTALSGSRCSGSKRTESFTAAARAASSIATPWWLSHFARRPRRISSVSSAEGSPTSIR